MTGLLRQFWLPIALIIIALPIVVMLSDSAASSRVALAESYEDADLELQGRKLKGFALGAEGLLADWYWIRSLQYIGTKLVKTEIADLNIEDLRPLNPRLLYPLLDNATDLDPKFIAAYSYGAVVLPAIDKEQAITFTEKGITNNPEAWRLYHYLGYIYWKNKDYENAARAYDRGAAVAGAPSFVREMAAAMRTRGGSRETAYQLYSQMRESAPDPQTRSNAELRLLQIDALDELDAVNAKLGESKERSGRCVSKIVEIFPALRGVELPRNRELRINGSNQMVDPTGEPYNFDQQACRISISNTSSIPPEGT